MPAWESFKTSLDEYHPWPCIYTFKFIVPSSQVARVFRLLDGHRVRTRDSTGGKYVSFTAHVPVDSSDDVIAFYQSASQIDGLIAL